MLGFDLLADIAAVERRFARQQFIDQGAEGVDVVLSGGAVSPELLGAHVGQRAGHKLVLGGRGHRAAQRSRDAEVGHFGAAGGVDHDVAGFQVAVHDPGLLVRVDQGLPDLRDPVLDLLGVENALRLFRAEFRQGRPVHVFHGDGGQFVGDEEVEYTDDARVRQADALLRLLLELGERAFVEAKRVGEDLQCDVDLESFVAGEPHNAHASLAEASLENKAVEEAIVRPVDTDRLFE